MQCRRSPSGIFGPFLIVPLVNTRLVVFTFNLEMGSYPPVTNNALLSGFTVTRFDYNGA